MASEYKKPEFQTPDTAALAAISLPSEKAVQPGWIGERHPRYTEDLGMSHELSSVRTAEHGGHQIKITTTYEIEIDGRMVHLHAIVDEDGQLHCHTTPYEGYRSAVDLVKTLIDRFPESFAGLRERVAAEGAGGHSHRHGGGAG